MHPFTISLSVIELLTDGTKLFNQDVADANITRSFKKPVLGIASNVAYSFYQYTLSKIAEDYQLMKLEDTAHLMFKENQPGVDEKLWRI